MKRFFDFVTSFFLFIFLLPLMTLISILIKVTSEGPVIFWSDRIGINSKIFKMPKFRTMFINTPNVATHLLSNSNGFITPIGKFLRKTSLDELPQLWSIFIGKMSFVGPRPALYNQYDLIELRKKNGVDTLIPGLTGWAQINGRDEISIEEKVRFDLEYLKKKSFGFDMKILFLTVYKVFARKDISH